jgi:hypothetical protein
MAGRGYSIADDSDRMSKIDHSISKTALVQEIQLYAYVAGQYPLAAANHTDLNAPGNAAIVLN